MNVLQRLNTANKIRDEQIFHHFSTWQPVDWSNAIAGEVGELCNLIKKMKRRNTPKDFLVTTKNIADEAADIVIYLEILCQNMGIDLGEAIVNKYNQTCETYHRPDLKIF